MARSGGYLLSWPGCCLGFNSEAVVSFEHRSDVAVSEKAYMQHQ